MTAIWRVRIKYYSLGFILLIVGIYIYKNHWEHWAVPLIGGVLMTLIFGGYMIHVEKLMKEDGTFRTDEELEQESPD